MAEDKVYTGTVVWFNSRAGIGFLAPDVGSKDLFIHYTNIKCEGFKTVNAGQRVKYKIGQNHRGDQAIEIEVIKEGV